MMKKRYLAQSIHNLSLVYFDVSVGGFPIGRLVFELFTDVVPFTTENFRCLATGETQLGYWHRPRWYQNSKFHRIIPNFMCQGGDFNCESGFGGESIYGQYFRDERFVYSHSKRGVLSMAHTSRPHTNNSQFFITFRACPWLDRKHVVFGHVVEGENLLEKIEEVGSPGGWPQQAVQITTCGQLSIQPFALKMIQKSNPRPTLLPPLTQTPSIPWPFWSANKSLRKPTSERLISMHQLRRLQHHF